MAVIACLQLPPDGADKTILDICAQLTPVVEPDGERIWMDWTGCGSVPELVAKLTAELTRAVGTAAESSDSIAPVGSVAPVGSTAPVGSVASIGSIAPVGSVGSADSVAPAVHPTRYRLGIAPLRFVAGAVAAEGSVVTARGGTVAAKGIRVTTGGGTVAAGGRAVAAGDSTQSTGTDRTRTHRHRSVFVIDTAVVSGCWITDEVLPDLLERLPISALPELDAIIQESFAALDVRTLGDLSRIPGELLYSHIGRAADTLLHWARGRDDSRVRALYPPERLERRISAEMLGLTGAADSHRAKTAMFYAAAELAAELEASHRACAELAVVISGQRLERSFTPPVTDPDQLARTIWQLAKQLLASHHHGGGDCTIIITPTKHVGKQMTLWASDRLGSTQGLPGMSGSGETKSARRSAVEHPALAAIRARFGHVFRIGGDEVEYFSGAREALERYEAMCRFYG